MKLAACAAANATQDDTLVNTAKQAFVVGVSTFTDKDHHFRQVHTPAKIQISEEQAHHKTKTSHAAYTMTS